MVYHRLDHICPEYGQPETINLYGPEYDQRGIILFGLPLDGLGWFENLFRNIGRSKDVLFLPRCLFNMMLVST